MSGALALCLAGCAGSTAPYGRGGEPDSTAGAAIVARVASQTLGADAVSDGYGVSEIAGPVSVTVMGEALDDLGSVVPVEELVEVAEAMDQDIEEELEAGEGGLRDSDDIDLESARVGGSLSVQTSGIVRTATAYTRLMVWNDNKYVQNVLRQGTSTWGWAHLKAKHNATQAMIKKTTMFPRSRTIEKHNIYCETPAIKYVCWIGICSIEKQMDVRVVYDTRKQSDKFAKGVVTAHCKGPVICPQWVRDVAG